MVVSMKTLEIGLYFHHVSVTLLISVNLVKSVGFSHILTWIVGLEAPKKTLLTSL